MDGQIRTEMIGRSCRPSRVLGRVCQAVSLLLPVAAVVTAGSVWGQLKTTQYTQLPAMAIEPIIIKPIGVYPQKIVRPKGPFLLYIENRLPGHTAHYSLTLNQANAAELTGLDTAAITPRTQGILDLMPGVYVLHIQSKGPSSLANQQQAEWSVTIQIKN